MPGERMNTRKYNIVMFAHNEERNIKNAIKSAFDNSDPGLNEFYVIVNGSTDRTAVYVAEAQKNCTKLKLVTLTLGDKCNAWNHYTHKIAPTCNANVHFFVDSDVQFTEQAFPVLYDKLLMTKTAVAVAGLPMSGRNKLYYQSLVTDGVCMFGNLYGLRDSFVQTIQKKNFKLPIGLSWIDSAITKAVNCDLTNQYQCIPNRITHQTGCGYTFNSLKPYSLTDIKLYINRLARYEIGKLQEKELDKLEFYEWPETCKEINQRILHGIYDGTIKPKSYLKLKIIKKLRSQIANQ